ncbi:MAG TPA: prepilin-type N-terminal cleavage/methylation domain-containing protein [Gemmataceae bacterium]|nr:prepilin-type N-terminal cleavage/methylation domain-containing protein [Gemmataceae bacterium]
MILHHQPSRVARRTAFTLLEVLVVVAIILVLASVATVATMSYLDDAKEDKTRMNMKTVETAAKGVLTRNSGQWPDDMDAQVIRKLSNGEEGMLDGWGNRMTIQQSQDQNGDVTVEVTTTHPKTGEVMSSRNIR